VVKDEPDQPSRGNEFAPLENTPPFDPYAPVDYPADAAPPPHAAQSPPYSTGYPPYPGSYPPYPTGYQPYPGGYPGYAPYGSGRPSGTNGKAIVGFVTSMVSLTLCGCFIPSLVGLVLGIVALRETKRTGQDGKGMALAAVIIGAVTLVGGIVLIAAALNDPSLFSDY
jgi:hypothetical protein